MAALDLLADLAADGVSVEAVGEYLVVRPASRLTDAMRIALRDVKPAVLTLLARNQPPEKLVTSHLAAVAWTDQNIARLLDLRARLLRWRWAEPEAEFLAERLVRRDREQDDRVSCVECRHYRPGRCGNYRRAGLSTYEVGHDLAGMLQRCTGFLALQPA